MHTKITNKKMLQLKKREKTKQKKQRQPAKQVNLTLALATCKSQNDPIEFVQTKFIRWLLGVNKFCSSNAVAQMHRRWAVSQCELRQSVEPLNIG